MKGVNKYVVEIVEPQNEYIERVVVFLREDKSTLGIAAAQQEAENYVQNLVCWKRRFWPGGKKVAKAAGFALLGLLALAGLAFILL